MALISGQELVQQALNGLFAGSIYALFAVGYTLVFGVLEILNLAHSAVFTLGAIVALTLTADRGWPFWLALPASVAICAAFGYVLELVAFRPLRRRGAPPVSALISSIGVALILVSLMEAGFGGNSRRYPTEPVPGGVLHAGGLVLDTLQIGIIAITLSLMAGLAIAVRRSRPGRAMRAVAENPLAARLMGIDVDRTIALTLVASSALGGLAGILFSVAQSDVSPFIGRDQVELKGLAVIVVGGMGSITGSVVAGFLLGLIEVAAQVALGANVRPAVAFGVLVVMLIARPTGLFARTLARRA